MDIDFMITVAQELRRKGMNCYERSVKAGKHGLEKTSTAELAAALVAGCISDAINTAVKERIDRNSITEPKDN